MRWRTLSRIILQEQNDVFKEERAQTDYEYSFYGDMNQLGEIVLGI